MDPNTEIMDFEEALAAHAALHPDEEAHFDFSRPLFEWPRPSLAAIVQAAPCAGSGLFSKAEERRADQSANLSGYCRRQIAQREELREQIARRVLEQMPPPVLRVIFLKAAPDGPHVFHTQPGDDH